MIKFRASCTISWDYEADDEANAEKLAGQFLDPRLKVSGLQIHKLKEPARKICLGEFAPDEVLPFIKKEGKKTYTVGGKDYVVKMNSTRYFVFREHMSCVACGLPVTKIFLECHGGDRNPHFNFYGEVDGTLVVMTKDHIHAKSCGGKDVHSNYQNMCFTCNNLKGHANLSLEDVREVRNFYERNKNKMEKKKFYFALEELKASLAESWDTMKSDQRTGRTGDVLFVVQDLNFWEKNGEFVAKPVYDAVKQDYNHVGCIRRGISIEPLLTMKETVFCQFGEAAVGIHQSLLSSEL